MDTIVFKNADFGKLRIENDNGKMLFNARDTCNCLGYFYPHGPIAKLKKRGEAFKRGKEIIITEAGFYRLLFKCTLPNAEEMQRWLFDEILPKLRKQPDKPPIDDSIDEKYYNPTEIGRMLKEPMKDPVFVNRALYILGLQQRNGDYMWVLTEKGTKYSNGKFPIGWKKSVIDLLEQHPEVLQQAKLPRQKKY